MWRGVGGVICVEGGGVICVEGVGCGWGDLCGGGGVEGVG